MSGLGRGGASFSERRGENGRRGEQQQWTLLSVGRGAGRE